MPSAPARIARPARLLRDGDVATTLRCQALGHPSTDGTVRTRSPPPLAPQDATDARNPAITTAALSYARRMRGSSAVVSAAAAATGAALAGLGALHVAWGRGSTFPFADEAELTDAVVGRDVTPSRAACFAVAGALGTAAMLVTRAGTGGGRLSRIGAAGVAAALLGRASFGFAGRTELVSPGSQRGRRTMAISVMQTAMIAATT